MLVFRKHFNSLIPDEASCPEAVEWLRKMKHGSFVRIERPKKPRNVHHHRKFFAMLNIVLANQDYYQNLDELLDVCKLAIGHVRVVRMRRGIFEVPKSLSFAAVDQVEFDRLYDAAVHWVCTECIPGMKRSELDAEVEQELLEFAA